MSNIQVIEIADDVKEIVIRIRPAHTQHIRGELGIDVSRHNGEVNWDAMLTAGVGFAGIRATMGATGKDNQFERNWREAKRVGIQRMAYHYYTNNTFDGEAQAENFLSATDDDPGELPPVCDVEPTANQFIADKIRNTDEISKFLRFVASGVNKLPLVYTNRWAWEACTNDPGWATSYGLWLAQYTLAPKPSIPLPWTQCQIWQYTNQGNVGGTRPIDLNRYGPYP